MTGRVVKGIGGFYYVYDGVNTYMGKARGNLKRNRDLIYVGDIVDYELDDNGECIINKVSERHNYLTRPPVSNLGMLVVVFAAAEPEPNFPVIDKLIAACEAKDIDVVVCITKTDLAGEDVASGYVSHYSGVYPTAIVNGISGAGISELADLIKGRNVALAGPSGVGKSTITNLLTGSDTAETGRTSDKTRRGRHTTRHVEIFDLGDGTFLYDTPGFTSLDLAGIEASEVGNLFPEIRNRQAECRYSDCMHINEPDCAIKSAVESGAIHPARYNSYLTIIDEVKKWHR